MRYLFALFLFLISSIALASPYTVRINTCYPQGDRKNQYCYYDIVRVLDGSIYLSDMYVFPIGMTKAQIQAYADTQYQIKYNNISSAGGWGNK